MSAQPARTGEEKPAREIPPAAEPSAAPAPPAKTDTWKAWLPLGVALLVMPALAYAVTNFILIPRLQHALTNAGAAPAEAPKAASAEGGGGEGGGEGKPALAPGQKQNVTLNKLLVNVAGTMGSRYLLASLVLAGSASDLPNRVAQNEPQLRDMASGLLSTKTIAELEKPGARNVIRGELLAGFNSILGNSAVQEIYFTEFAIQ
jgi:flagellar FliL protein